MSKFKSDAQRKAAFANMGKGTQYTGTNEDPEIEDEPKQEPLLDRIKKNWDIPEKDEKKEEE